MLKLSKSILYVAFSSVLLISTSCKKEGCTDPLAINYNAEADKGDGSCQYPEEETGTEKLEAIIDGDAFSAPFFSATHENNQYDISGTEDGIGISLSLSDANSDGNLGPSSANYVVTGGQESANSGSYSYTVNDGVISGSFSFETDTHTITNGVFTVEL
ncbi:MAG: hypothetical protein ACQERC_12400 [Bacteroidota bacterium]